jgi:hypothetical protein
MGTLQWLEHFRSSVARERPIQWDRGVDVPDTIREPVLQSLRVFQRGLSSPGLNLRSKVRRSCAPEYAECVDLYVREKQIHAELLLQLVWRSGSEPAGRAFIDFLFRRVRRRFDWARELTVLLTAEMVSMPFLRVLSNHVNDPVFRQVLESILADQAYHLGFHIEHLRAEIERRPAWERVFIQQAWTAFFSGALTLVIADNQKTFDALGYDRLAFWTDAWNLFAQVQSGLVGSRHMSSILGRDPRIRFVV